MFWFWFIVNILIVLYIIHSLSTIKHQLRQISKRLNLNEIGEVNLSDEEIEKLLEDDVNHKI
jgi:hypothetical protein